MGLGRRFPIGLLNYSARKDRHEIPRRHGDLYRERKVELENQINYYRKGIRAHNKSAGVSLINRVVYFNGNADSPASIRN